jgi:hypothetical protein
MPRSHEDLERHTPVDHRPGGQAIEFSVGAWCAVVVAHVKAERVEAALSSYETLIEKARSSSAKAQATAVFRSPNKRRVIALITIDGHDSFRHIQSAWDDHHLSAEHRDVAESSSLVLYRCCASTGEAVIDPSSTDAYAFEHVARPPQKVSELIAPIGGAQGFRGMLIFGADDATSAAVLYRFVHHEEIDSFRTSRVALNIVGPVGAAAETTHQIRLIKTFE